MLVFATLRRGPRIHEPEQVDHFVISAVPTADVSLPHSVQALLCSDGIFCQASKGSEGLLFD
jgi:hypothetical protein